MRFKIRETLIRIDWLMLLFPLIAIRLGEGRAVSILAGSLIVHEIAHWLAAKWLHVEIYSLRLTPFGGLARMENPYSVDALRLCLIAAAGPASNFLLAISAAALTQWNLLPAAVGGQWVRINFMLMIFNLIPALPLDGGRLLYGLLSAVIPKASALKMGIRMGYALAVFLIGLSVWGMLRCRALNLSPLFIAVFLIVSARDEQNAFDEGHLRNILIQAQPLRRPIRAALIAVESGTSLEDALRAAAPNQMTLYAVYDQGHFSKLVDSRTLLSVLTSQYEKQ